ncbi:cell envelope integrity EipB family protein [Pararhizobium mangrovi]|uniref:DUF1849 family protein n=1 Tax=Pararhizobium mangrovi TaxID=2590452 RepID=A0A506UBA0_9HYPH|nr:cell envelope integrity EipB family protein [Pararhizobium mangrovi]TPW31210.1 DUF1849 family protein [Pararhizobium mangrovi]
MRIRAAWMAKAAALVWLLAGNAPAFAVSASDLATHRAVYDLSLVDATDRSGVGAMNGRMVYEFTGSSCEGFSSRFRLVTQMASDGTVRVSDQQSTTYEDLKRRIFRFINRSFVDDRADSVVRGLAEGEANGIAVDVTRPAGRHFDLPAALFPTEHTLEMIDHAQKGERVYQSTIYDGTGRADATSMTTVVLGHRHAPDPQNAETKALGSMADQPYWPASVAFFDQNKRADETPSYRMEFKLYRNGVTRDLTMDYGDFALHGTLVDLAFLKQPTCTQ